MDDEERLEGDEEMELEEGSEGEDEDEDNPGCIPISPANSDQLLLGPASTAQPSPASLSFHAESLSSNARDAYNSEFPRLRRRASFLPIGVLVGDVRRWCVFVPRSYAGGGVPRCPEVPKVPAARWQAAAH